MLGNNLVLFALAGTVVMLLYFLDQALRVQRRQVRIERQSEEERERRRAELRQMIAEKEQEIRVLEMALVRIRGDIAHLDAKKRQLELQAFLPPLYGGKRRGPPVN